MCVAFTNELIVGVVRVGEVAKTSEPDPVSSEIALAIPELVETAESTPDDVDARPVPVKNVPVFPPEPDATTT